MARAKPVEHPVKASIKPKSKSQPNAGAGKAVSKEVGGAGKPLTPTVDLFVTEYLIDLNGTQAYMRVFPKIGEKSARTLAARLLAKVGVFEKVAELKDAQTERALAWAAKPGSSEPAARVSAVCDAYNEL